MEALRAWVAQWEPPPPTRFPFVVRAFNFGLLDLDDTLKLLANESAHHQQRLDWYRGIEASMTEPSLGADAPQNERSGWRFTLELGIRIEEMWLDWCAWAEQRAREMHP